MSNWNWTESTNEEFDKLRMTQTYYRIYHKIDDKNVIDYKFWAKDDNEALETLNRYISEHDDGKQHFYSTSGYYVNSDKKRFDSMEEMHEEWKKEPYDEEDRKYDTRHIYDCLKDCESEKRISTIEELKKLKAGIDTLLLDYENSVKELKDKASKTDLKVADMNVIEDISALRMKVDDTYYELSDLAYLLKNKHFKNEIWSLYDHILEDLKFNLPKVIVDKNGYPTKYTKLAAESLNIEVNDYCQVKSKENEKTVSELALKMWTDRLTELLDAVLDYRFYSEYGIVDGDDELLKNHVKNHNLSIIYKPGTYQEIDYAKISEKAAAAWNKIWDWMKVDGASLWT